MRALLFLALSISAFLGFFFCIVVAGAVLAHWTTPAIGMGFELAAPLALVFAWERRKSRAVRSLAQVEATPT